MHRKTKSALIIGLVFILVALSAAASYSGVNNSSLKVKNIKLPGAAGEANNVASAFGRYALVAPFAPSVELEDDSPLNDFDNHYIHLVDTHNPGADVVSADLQFYYPTKVVFDPVNNAVFVRGTDFIQTEGGDLQTVETLARLHLNLNENEEPVFDTSVAKIPIKGVNETWASDAPIDFVLGYQGKYLIFTNGASIYTYRATEEGNFLGGELYSVTPIAPKDFGPDFHFSSLDIDEATNTIIATISGREKVQGEWTNFSELYFYRLVDNGTLDLVKWVTRDKLTGGSSLAPGSNAAISIEPDIDNPSLSTPSYAYFVTVDGTLYQVSLRDNKDYDGSLYGTPEVLDSFPELAQENVDSAGPRLISYNPSSRTIGIAKLGFKLEIRRPVHEKPGRPGIRRPVHAQREAPALVVAQFNKKNKLVKRNVFTAEFEGEEGISNLVFDQKTRLLVATYGGKLYSADLSSASNDSSLQMIGKIGSRVTRLVPGSIDTSVFALRSVESEEDGWRITSPGSLVIASEVNSKQPTGAILQMLIPPASILKNLVPSIRRPCNIRP